MSFNELVADVLTNYAVAWQGSDGAECFGIAMELFNLIEQHVAEAVERETERCVKACGTQMVRLDRLPNQTEFIRNVTVGRCIEAIRARAEKETA